MSSCILEDAKNLWVVIGKPDELSPVGIQDHLRQISRRVSLLDPRVAKAVVKEYFIITALLCRTDIYSLGRVMFWSGTDDVFCEVRSTIVGCGGEASALVLANARNLHVILKSWSMWPHSSGLRDLGRGIMNIMNELNESLGPNAYTHNEIAGLRERFTPVHDDEWDEKSIADLYSIYEGLHEEVLRKMREVMKKNGKNWFKRQT